MQKNLLLIFILVLLGCDKKDPLPLHPKLKSVTSYFQDQQREFRPGEKTVYTYNASGELESSQQFQYDTQTREFYHFSTDTYTYDNGFLKTILKNVLQGSLQTTTTFGYEGGKISKITHTENVTTVATVQYRQDTTEVFYQLNNGRSFTYKFVVKDENIVYEKTIGDDHRLASESRHEYDVFNNPYRLLAYTDLFFRNYTACNKTKTSSHYYSLAFPQSTPIAYAYEYNALDYPTQQLTTYQSTGSNPATYQLKTEFEYEE